MAPSLNFLNFIPGIPYLSLLTPYLIFLGFLILMGFVFSFLKFKITTDLKNIQIEREINKEKLFAGDYLRVTLTIQNSGWLMVDHLYIADLLPDILDLALGENFLSTSVPPDSKVEFSYVVTSQVRGEYKLGPIYLAFKDRAGMFVSEKEVTHQQEVIFYPRYEGVRRIQNFKRSKGSILTGKHRINEKGQGYDFSRLREYLPTDDIRYIDWKASARMNDLIVREYEKEKNLRFYIFLDISRSMGYGKRKKTKLDYMVRAATFLAYMANRAEDTCGLLTYSQTPHNFIYADRGEPHLFRIINAVSKVHHKGSSNLTAAMRLFIRREQRVAIPFIFSDLENNTTNLIEGVKIAVAHKLNPIILSPLTPHFEEIKKDQEEEGAFNELALAEYLDRHERIKQKLLAYKTDVIDVKPDDIIAGALEAYFKSKARSGGIM